MDCFQRNGSIKVNVLTNITKAFKTEKMEVSSFIKTKTNMRMTVLNEVPTTVLTVIILFRTTEKCLCISFIRFIGNLYRLKSGRGSSIWKFY